MSKMMLSIARDFSPSPAGRVRADGPFNGQRFRDELLVPALERAIAIGETVTVSLDGIYSLSSSFLEETFGGLVRLRKFQNDELKKSLRISADDPVYEAFCRDAEKYLADEMRKLR